MQTTIIRNQADIERMFAEVRERFTRLVWGPFLESEMRLMEAEHEKYWSNQAGPSGSPWPMNAASTIARKKHSIILVGIRPKQIGEPKLRDAMTLPFADGAIRIAVDEWPRARIYFGNDVAYSKIHNLGLGKMPQREHVGLTLPHFQSMATRAEAYALKGLVK